MQSHSRQALGAEIAKGVTARAGEASHAETSSIPATWPSSRLRPLAKLPHKRDDGAK
jgi:hypothetical protein